MDLKLGLWLWRVLCGWLAFAANAVAIHQRVQAFAARVSGVAGEVGVAGGGQDAVVAQDLLHLQQIDTGFDQVRGVAVAKAVGRNLFLRPISCTTRARVRCTPPLSSGLLAVWAPACPAARLGNSSVG